MERLKNIDSLRTVAAVFVFLYHVDILSGGFIGVDIFFVISGFIISNIIYNQKLDTKFIFNFFIVRINRLLPALIVLGILSMILGYFILLPEEIEFLSKTILNSLVFNSNNFFYTNTNYFSEVSNSPILHSWTLGIEFQFYIFIILFFLIFSKKFKFWLILAIFTSICLAQFGGNLKFQSPYLEEKIIFFSPIYGSFYLLPTRIFEFLIGSFFFTYSNKIKKIQSLEYLAALIIILSALYFNKNTANPSLLNFIICISTGYLIINNENKNHYIQKLLNLKPLYSFGLLTYGFYIWHYTIIFFYKLYFGKDLFFFDHLTLIILSLLFTYVGFYILEKPMNDKKVSYLKKNIFYLISILLLSLIFFLNIKTSGFSFRIDDKTIKKIISFDEIEKINSECRGNIFNNICTHGNSDNINTVLWGDSHANQLVPVLTKIANEKKFGFFEYSNMGCPPIKNMERLNKASQNCAKKSKIIYDKIINNPKIKNVIIHAYWNYYFDKNHTYAINNSNIDAEFRNELLEMSKNNKTIYLILSIPEMNVNPRKYYIRNKIHKFNNLEYDKNMKISLNNHKKKNHVFSRSIKKIKNNKLFIFDPASVLCDNKNCYSFKNDKLLYRDNSHISKKNSHILYDQLNKFLSIEQIE